MSRLAKQIVSIERETFASQGFLVKKSLLPIIAVERLQNLSESALNPVIGPVEFEAEVGYPGSPRSRSERGGDTPRRLLHAFGRDPAFEQLATHDAIKKTLTDIMLSTDLFLSQNHHNCVMTKHPGFSSSTSWHQDIRYWSFDRPELVSIWCALGNESEANGALSVIPASHRLNIDRGRLDRDLFLRLDLDENLELVENQVQIQLEAGDVLFFHCRLFHAAGQNLSEEVKHSVVFTYHTGDNQPIPGTRSDRYPSIPLS